MKPDLENPPAITEEMHVHHAWFHEAQEQTIETLPEFIERTMNGYRHDYGTVCYAIAACCVATGWACNRMKGSSGGITGFQSGAVMWGFVRHWLSLGDQPLKLMQFDKMLYPQSRDDFEKRIDSHTWTWLREEAGKRLADRDAADRVRDHWRSVANGQVPFGYSVQLDE